MSDLLLPNDVAREIQKDRWVERRRAYRARLDLLIDWDDPVCVEWNKVIPPDFGVRMGRARPMAYEPGWTVIPGFYHWVRDNDGAPPTVSPICGEDEHGNPTFREPTSDWLERLKASDLQNPHVFAALLLHQEQREREEAERVAAERLERQTEMLERYKAGNRAFVSTSTDSPWSQSVKGKRGR